MRTPATEARLSSLIWHSFLARRLRLGDRLAVWGISEFEARDGRPDFVLSPTPLTRARRATLKALGRGILTPGDATVLSGLHQSPGISASGLAPHIGLSALSVGRALARFETLGIASKDTSGNWRRSRELGSLDIELWAIEVKLKDWNHGLYQALQSRAFAQSALLVMPIDYIHTVSPRLEVFRKFNIGVAIFSKDTGGFHYMVRPKKSKPQSQAHYIYGLSVFARRMRSA